MATNDEDTFLAELLELSLKHGFVIAGCGCCGSPWVEPIKRLKHYQNSIPSPSEVGIEKSPPKPFTFDMGD